MAESESPLRKEKYPMNILLIDIGSFIQPDIIYTLNKMNINCKNIKYIFPNGDTGKYHNEEFERLMRQELNESSYDAVFSTNLIPIIGKIAYESNLPYIAWSYDSPLNLSSHEYFDLPNTNVFLFDRTEAENFRKSGYDNFHHLPLAVNCERLSKISAEPRFQSDISFVGKLYSSTYPILRSEMDPYEQGYCDALITSQLNIYGSYFISNSLTPELINSINQAYNSRAGRLKNLSLTAAQLSYSMASHITHIERISLLNMLSSKYDVHLYTGEDITENELLSKKVRVHGTLSYSEEMPAVFKSSSINLCPALKATQSGIPLRALDIIGSASFILSNWQAELAENFMDGEEVVMYESMEDALEKADFYLKHSEIRQSIAHAGFKKASENFRYEDRISYMLQCSVGS